MKTRIIKNAIKCKHCGEVIESKSVHDFQTCRCGRVSVDGGLEYLKRCFTSNPNSDYVELCVVQEIS